MSLTQAARAFDKYTLVARVYPALICIAPAIWSFPILDGRDWSSMQGWLGVFGVVCTIYLLASLARYRGKIVEPVLLERWGGWPSTLLLRHRDTTIDASTKARYHSALASLCGGLHIPTAAEEATAPTDADAVYRSMTKRLIEARRGTQYRLLHDENASYGFRRNLLGLKPLAVGIALLCAAYTGALWWWASTPQNVSGMVASASTAPTRPLLTLVDLIYVLAFIWLVREKFVYQSAKEYAEALLRTLDADGGKPRRPPGKSQHASAANP